MADKDKLYKYLQDWTISFVKNKDILTKSIKSIKENGFDLTVEYKDRVQLIVIEPLIDNIDAIISKFDEEKYCTIVLLNSKENFDIFLKNWGKLITFKHLSVYFVNPFLEVKWIIHPVTHNKICDESSLKQGLKSMFDSVEPIGFDEAIKRI